jgi:hypothetical protein
LQEGAGARPYRPGPRHLHASRRGEALVLSESCEYEYCESPDEAKAYVITKRQVLCLRCFLESEVGLEPLVIEDIMESLL